MLGQGCIFSESFQPIPGPNLLGGNEEIIAVMAGSLEKLGMLQPPRAADLSISALGKEITSEGAKKGRFDRLIVCGPDGLARLRFRAFYSRTLGGRRRPWSAECRRRMGGHSSRHPG